MPAGSSPKREPNSPSFQAKLKCKHLHAQPCVHVHNIPVCAFVLSGALDHNECSPFDLYFTEPFIIMHLMWMLNVILIMPSKKCLRLKAFTDSLGHRLAITENEPHFSFPLNIITAVLQLTQSVVNGINCIFHYNMVLKPFEKDSVLQMG